MKKEFSAGTDAQSSTTADNSTSASVAASPMLAAALSVEEGNKLIGEFMNHPFIKKWKCYNYKGEFPYKDLKYHSSWDWLMPVVEKISEKKVDVSISHACGYDLWHCSISGPYEQPPYIHNRSNIMTEAVWLAVVEFIKWYNVNGAAVGSR
jgi:hypothetical protein